MNEDPQNRLNFLLQVVEKEIKHLRYSQAQVFPQPFTADQAKSLQSNEALAERVEAFTSRFARLQDTLGDKLLPAWLSALNEPIGAAIDNLDRAEKLGALASVNDWQLVRQLRNQMVLEYIADTDILSQALNAANQHADLLYSFAMHIIKDANKRNSN